MARTSASGGRVALLSDAAGVDSQRSYALQDTDTAGSSENSSDGGFCFSLRYKSPQLVLPLLAALIIALVAVIALAALAHGEAAQPAVLPVNQTASTCCVYCNQSQPPVEQADPPSCPTLELDDRMTAEAVYRHLNGLQRAADAGNGSRRTGTAGYAASLAYVESVLQHLPSLTPQRQPWTLAGQSGVNLYADTTTGDAHNTIVVGAHLDAVYSGLNDNGSGSSVVLALAQGLDAMLQQGLIKLVNRVRFHWYDKEESGLVGSRAAVAIALNSTSAGERLSDQVAMLNGDMLGSPNWIMGILDGRTLPRQAANASRAGSAVLTEMFITQLTQRGYAYRAISDNRYLMGSDQWSYWAAGVPAAILFTGVSEVHTAQDVADWGGLLGVRADACYHQTCDNVLNVSPIILARQAAMYGAVLQQLTTSSDIRSLLQITQPVSTLPPSLHELVSMDAQLQRDLLSEDDDHTVFVW